MSDKEDDDKSKHDSNKSPFSLRRAKKLLVLSEYLSKQESRNTSIKVSRILKKAEHERSEEEKKILQENQDIAKRIHKNKEKRQLSEQRVQEIEDTEDDLQKKCEDLAKAIQKSRRTVVYTGAGISTAASIPDYRGPQGVWTLLQKGEQLKPQDLSDAEPTLTHMCITKLHKEGHVSHVVSQNCDGLHIRSGLPRRSLSEVHGNMYIEICYNCKPHREFIRLFDVTENTGVRRHDTGRKCYRCGSSLRDTIVHFGEKGGMKSPYRWKEAVRAANKSDLILCLGSSLKILKKYSCLWCMDRAKNQRPDLVIVNLQWTPKDDSATLKIHGRCDDVLTRVLKFLGYTIPTYSREDDPIFRLATCLGEVELETTSKKVLQKPSGLLRLRSAQDYHTPTPSESESSSSSSSSSTRSSSESQTEEDTSEEIDMEEIIREIQEKEEARKQRKSLSKEELYQSKSERICLEAIKAMQAKQANKHIEDAVNSNKLKSLSKDTEKVSPTKGASVSPIKGASIKSCPSPKTTSVSLSSTITVLQNRLAQQQQHKQQPHQQENTQQQQQLKHVQSSYQHLLQQENQQIQSQHMNVLIDPLAGSPFDPGPTYEQKLLHLQMLQVQLETLKQKQMQLKHHESPSHFQNFNHPTGPPLPVMCQTSLLSPPSVQQSSTSQPYQILQQLYLSPPKQTVLPHSKPNNVDSKNGLINMNMNNVCVKFEDKEHKDLKGSLKMVSLLGKAQNVNKGNLEPIGSVVKTEVVTQEELMNLLVAEQNSHERQLASERQRCDKEMQDLQTYHQAEMSRLYQLHLVQQQILEQGKTSPRKLEENSQLFVQQQQLMLQHQNKQRQELAQRHQVEYNHLVAKCAHIQQESLLKMNLTLLQMCQDKKPDLLAEHLSQSNVTLHNYSSNTFPKTHNESPSLKQKPAALSSKGKAGSTKPKSGISQVKKESGKKVVSGAEAIVVNELKVDVLLKELNNKQGMDKSKPISPHALLSPGKTDFSIDAIMHTPVSALEQTSFKIPGFSELVDKLRRCESCRFLSDYGISKQRCSSCNDLKYRHNVSSSPILANSQNPKTTFHDVPNVNTHHPVSFYVTTSSKSATSSQVPSEQNYLTAEKSSSKGGNSYSSTVSIEKRQTVATKDLNNTVSVPQSNIETFIGAQSKGNANNISLPTSSLRKKDSPDCDNQELSPVIPYAGGESRVKLKTLKNNAPVISLTNSVNLQQMKTIEKNQNFSVTDKGMKTKTSDSGTVKHVLEGSNEKNALDCDAEKDLTEQRFNGLLNEIADRGIKKETADYVLSKTIDISRDGRSNSASYSKSISFADKSDSVRLESAWSSRPHRSRSQSAIYESTDQLTVADGGDYRLARSLSTDEVASLDTGDKSDIKGDNLSPSKLEESTKSGRKRKLSTQVSVPGWFGKGLNMKKRRKY